jgi:general secretion pathway protein G
MQKKGQQKRCRGGFSLLEITLVVIIIGVLMAVVAVNMTGQGNAAKLRATKASMKVFKTVLGQYNLEHNSYPPDLRTLETVKLVDPGKNKDGWNRDFFYDPRGRNNDQPYLLSSNGPDGTAGTEDDINVWTMDN